MVLCRRIDVIGWMGDKFEEWEVTTPTRIKRKQPHSPHALYQGAR